MLECRGKLRWSLTHSHATGAKVTRDSIEQEGPQPRPNGQASQGNRRE